MSDFTFWTTALALIVVGAPGAMLAILGLSAILNRPLTERATSRIAATAIVIGLLAAIALLAAMIRHGTSHVAVDLGNWIVLPDYHFHIKLLLDGLSLPFVILALLLCGTVSAFAAQYMHQESGFNRFFMLYALFVLGMVLSSLAGTIETLFTGWELVGLSSALLVAFFQERPKPARNGLRVWTVYRLADAAFLVAIVLLHHLHGEGDFDTLLGTGPWPGGQATLSASHALIVGLLLLVTAAGKSALIPFSGWLPRAMEGPTPSSAVFYGALSVHLGTFLLLRVSPIIELSPWLAAAVVALGLLTALFASLAGRVQADIKGALSFASLTQVGLIVAEIGLGLRWIALAHMIGHACLRTLQFLRAPTLLHDYHTLENAIGGHLPRLSGRWTRVFPEAVHIWFYRLALERGYLDQWLNDFVARPFLRFFQGCDWLERQWTDLLTRGRSRESDRLRPASRIVDDLS